MGGFTDCPPIPKLKKSQIEATTVMATQIHDLAEAARRKFGKCPPVVGERVRARKSELAG